MRASKNDMELGINKHISGAEKITKFESIDGVVKSLIDRAFNHDRGRADKINISIETLEDRDIIYIPCLDVFNIESKCVSESFSHALKLLEKIDIDRIKGFKILQMLDSVSNMRGAILLHAHLMKRLDLNIERGIRATGLDWREELLPKLRNKLTKHDMDNNHVIEALALASKVIHNPGVLGEICISDDPNYTTGYISIKGLGYFRIKNFKIKGSQSGVRIILFDGTIKQSEDYIDFLEQSVTVINSLPNIR